jgi:hypothetical protein
MRTPRLLPSGLVSLALVSGCTSGGGGGSIPIGPHTQSHSLPASSTRVPGATVESSFPTYGLSLRQPVAWQLSTFEVTSSFSSVIGYFSTEELHDPCVRSGNGSRTCGSPLRHLEPGGVLVTWSTVGMPGARLVNQPGTASTIDGHPARVASGPADASCASLGGEVSVDAVIASQQTDSHDQLVEMAACLRGPDVGQDLAAIQQMLDSVRLSAN